jgi:hypothetical protein
MLPTVLSKYATPSPIRLRRESQFLQFISSDILSSCLRAFVSYYEVFRHLLVARRQHQHEVALRGSSSPSSSSSRHFEVHSLPLTDPFLRLTPFAFVWLSAVAWAVCSPARVFEAAPRPFLFAFGFLFCNFV